MKKIILCLLMWNASLFACDEPVFNLVESIRFLRANYEVQKKMYADSKKHDDQLLHSYFSGCINALHEAEDLILIYETQ